MEKLHNTVYKTTNIIDRTIYIGVHCTDIIDDSYVGSGKVIKNAIKKYGKQNFKKEILYDVDTAELAYFIEELLVDDEFIKRKDVYNIKVGGTGGQAFLLHTQESKNKMLGRIPWNKGKILRKHTKEENMKNSIANSGINNAFYNKSHKQESKDLIRKKLLGTVPVNKGKVLTEIEKRNIRITRFTKNCFTFTFNVLMSED